MFIAVTAALAMTPGLVFAANFSDVPQNHKNAVAIQTLKDAGLISGYGDGTFQPDKNISRAEASAIIMKAAGITATKTSKKLPFTDVPETAWFYPVIQKGVELGKLKGYEDKTFRPDNPVNLPEALALTVSFFQISTKNIQVDPLIYDGLKSTEWYAKQAQYAKDQLLIEPDSNGKIDLASPLTRAALAEIIYRMRIVQQTKRPFDITSGWKTTEYKENFWKLKYPADWELFQGQKNSAVWKKGLLQAFFTRVWPTGARVSISVVDNPINLSYSTYFANLKDSYHGGYFPVKPIFSDYTVSSRPALRIDIPTRRIIDLCISLPNNSFLMIYGEAGEAPIGEFLKKQVEQIIMSYEYVERPPEPPKPVIPLEDRMGTLRENILIANKWKDISALFPDKKLIKTDAIGIGTGPVDYYFTKEANTTIKLERNSGTVLNIKEGSTDAF